MCTRLAAARAGKAKDHGTTIAAAASRLRLMMTSGVRVTAVVAALGIFLGVTLGALPASATPPAPADWAAHFMPAVTGERIANATNIVPPGGAGASTSACAAACLRAPECVSFTFDRSASSCSLHAYSMSYDRAVAVPSSAWYVRKRPRNDTRVVPAVVYPVSVPSSGVRLHSGIMLDAFRGEIEYLLSFYTVDDILYHYRKRGQPGGLGPAAKGGQACTPNAATAKSHGWDGGLKGSVSGLFLMGSGGVLRWEEVPELRTMMDAVVQGIRGCAQDDGYIMPFPQNDTIVRENPNYVTAWVTHGMIEASIAGNTDALPLMRGHLSWFNNNTYLPLFLPAAGGPLSYSPDFYPNIYGNAFDGGSSRPPDPGGDGSFTAINDPVAGLSEPTCSQDVRKNGGIGCSNHHALSLMYQGMIKHTRMALTALGTQADVDVVRNLYEERWWLEQLAARNVSAIWLRHFDPHNYENTAFEAYLEMYVLTGEVRYLDAVQGAWELSMEHFIHVGGAMAYNQNSPKPVGAPGSYAPGTYHLNEYGWWPPTGELCGSVFWAKVNQRFHRLFPDQEKYVTEIERSIYNVGIAAQGLSANGARAGGIRYFAVMHGTKAAADGE